MLGSRRTLCILVFLLMPAGAAAGQVPTLSSGAVELGAAGSMVTVEGVTSGTLSLRGGYFRAAQKGLIGFEAGLGFLHVESFDETELDGGVSWQHRFRESATYPYVSVGGGLRYESIGSFGHTRYPLGFSVGARTLVGARGGFRVEYRFRRILNDPAGGFSEHHVVLGLSLFFRN
jgi:hypothetical protein